MRRLLWVLAWIAVAVWSLFAWGAYGLVDLLGGLAAGNVDALTGHPGAVESLSWLARALRGLGLFAVVAVWALLSSGILALAWVLTRVGARRTPERMTPERRTPARLSHQTTTRVDDRADQAAYARDLVKRFDRR